MMKKNKSTLRRLIFSAAFRRYSLTVVAAEAVAVLLGAVSPLAQKFMIDGASRGTLSAVLYAASVLALLLVGQFALRSLGRLLRGILGVELHKKLKSDIFRHLLALPEEFLRSRGAGYFFNRIQHDIGEIGAFVTGNGLLQYSEMVKLAAAALVILYLNWSCLLLLLPFLLLQVFFCYRFRRRQYQLAHQLQECVAQERQLMQEYLATHTIVKTHSVGASAGERIDDGLSRWGSLMRNRLGHENVFLACLQIPMWLCGGSILLFGLYQVIEQQTTLGEVWALLMLMNMFFAPARTLGGIIVQQQSALAAWWRLQELWRTDTEDGAGSVPEVDLRGEVVFDKVVFGYNPSRMILNKLSLQVPWGSGVFLCGANGSGKSTLFSLLLRLYAPGQGSIKINNCNINDYPLAEYRQRIGYIGQYLEFIPGTLRDNLLMGKTAVSDETLEALFRQLDCADLLERLPDKLDTMVAERGENFSGGERLRLVLVRELLRDTDWLLFDEAAANLDMAGRQRFYELLQKLPGQKGVIAIAHDLPENSSWPVLQIEKLQE
ncbi:MAG: ABC transporter ATP-binding protein [Lentisphaerae bacterium]|nr:ABC transporter ATP-binding protein [Lentisphaerota bacterium]